MGGRTGKEGRYVQYTLHLQAFQEEYLTKNTEY